MGGSDYLSPSSGSRPQAAVTLLDGTSMTVLSSRAGVSKHVHLQEAVDDRPLEMLEGDSAMRKLLAVIVLLPLPILAAPDSTTQYFMNEPASLFDLGMHRLQAFGHRSSGNMTLLYKDGAKTDQKMTYGSGNIHAGYDPDGDMIYIYFSVADEQANEQQMENGCRDVLGLLRIDTSKSIWRMFAHYGQERDNPSQAMV